MKPARNQVPRGEICALIQFLVGETPIRAGYGNLSGAEYCLLLDHAMCTIGRHVGTQLCNQWAIGSAVHDPVIANPSTH